MSDGIEFDTAIIGIEPIREGQAYDGLRARFKASLGRAIVPMQIDVGFGDATEPGLADVELPASLDLPRPRLLGYRPETVVAEKLEAMVRLGLANTRMKDFHDVYALAASLTFRGSELRLALRATFERRATAWPTTTPTPLSDQFVDDVGKQAQWKAFLDRNRGIVADRPLREVVAGLRDFMSPLLGEALDAGERLWIPGKGWTAGG